MKLIYIIFVFSFTVSFAQNQPVNNQIYLDKLIKFEKTNYFGYRYYSQKGNNKLNAFALNSLFREENAVNSTRLLRNSRLVKIGAILLAASTSLLPTTKTTTGYIGGFPATIRSPNYGNQILSIGIGCVGGVIFRFGQHMKNESVMEYNGKIKRKYYK